MLLTKIFNIFNKSLILNIFYIKYFLIIIYIDYIFHFQFKKFMIYYNKNVNILK